jgi:hypothetical protein
MSNGTNYKNTKNILTAHPFFFSGTLPYYPIALSYNRCTLSVKPFIAQETHTQQTTG